MVNVVVCRKVDVLYEDEVYVGRCWYVTSKPKVSKLDIHVLYIYNLHTSHINVIPFNIYFWDRSQNSNFAYA